MTLQQLRYAVAIDRYRSFAAAADALDVTQPTLSGMIGKLEEELDVKLFERSSRKVSTTTIGTKIVEQARRILMETDRIKELVSESKQATSGNFRLAVGPSIAPYILPDFIRIYIAIITLGLYIIGIAIEYLIKKQFYEINCYCSD